jgi:hypothetical protein
MSEQTPIRQQLEQSLVKEHIALEVERRKQINQRLVAILGFLLPAVTAAITVPLLGPKSIFDKSFIIRLALVAVTVSTFEFFISGYLRIHKPNEKTLLKWTVADLYSRQLNESAFNPQKDVITNDEQSSA